MLKNVSRVWLFAITTAMTVFANEPAKKSGHSHGPSAGVTAIDVVASGKTIDLLYAEAEGHATQLLHIRSKDAGETWTQPVRVDAGQPALQNAMRGFDPQIVASGERLFAVWMTKGTGLFDSGPMVTAISSDGGPTWKPGPNPADDNSTAGHSFVDLVADGQGRLHIVWLDGRDGRQGLRYANSADHGRTWSRNVTLKAGTCECCWNKLAIDAKGDVHALFRDKDPRDMALVSLVNGGAAWKPPVAVGKFDWQFGGCPHVGGALAASGRNLHALVWTGADGKMGVHHVTSTNQGRTWSEPRRICDGKGRRADLAVAGKKLVTAWDALGEGHSEVWLAESTNGGAWSAPRRISLESVSANYPRIVTTAAGPRVFWTEAGASGYSKWRMFSP